MHQPQPCVASFLHAKWLTSKQIDRKSTRLNSSHANISYAVFCLKKKKKKIKQSTKTTHTKHYRQHRQTICLQSHDDAYRVRQIVNINSRELESRSSTMTSALQPL